VHNYLGMTFDFSEDGVVKITRKDYIKEMLDEVPDNMGGKVATPAENHLFMASDGHKLLNKDDSPACFITTTQQSCCSYPRGLDQTYIWLWQS
jgi:hypothetical protein